MTEQISENHEQVVNLLPAYANGHLTTSVLRRVRSHLLTCAICQQELANWEAIQDATTQVFAVAPLPSAQLMSVVWEKIDAPLAQTHVLQHWSFKRTLLRLWLLFRAQIPLLHKSIWLASALVCLFGLILSLLMDPYTASQKHLASSLLVLFIVVVGASGSAFISGSAVDPGFELMLSTPTSVRLLMLCRLTLVVGYNLLLAIIASAAFALVYGGSLWGFVQLWLGPLIFFSSLGLAMSLVVGSAFALFCTAIIEIVQAFPQGSIAHLLNFSWPWPALNLGSTSPALLIAALVLIVFAVFFVPKQPRLASLT